MRGFAKENAAPRRKELARSSGLPDPAIHVFINESQIRIAGTSIVLCRVGGSIATNTVCADHTTLKYFMDMSAVASRMELRKPDSTASKGSSLSPSATKAAPVHESTILPPFYK
jgi:hypothetical protein